MTDKSGPTSQGQSSLGQSSQGQSSQGPDDRLADQRIRQALHKVAIPPGLAERLQSRLAATVFLEPEVVDEVNIDQVDRPSLLDHVMTRDVVSAQLESPCAATLSPAHSTLSGAVQVSGDGRLKVSDQTRRAILVLACAACLAGFAWLAQRWQQPHERDWLADRCNHVLAAWENDNPANLLRQSSVNDLPESVRSQLVRTTIVGTRVLSELIRNQPNAPRVEGMLYRLDAHDGQAMVLMKLPGLKAVRGLNSRFTLLDTPSGGWSMAAMTVNNETYVLAAVCTQQQLLGYIRQAAIT